MRNKWRTLCLLLPVVLFLAPARGQVASEKNRFRVVGYYSLQAAITDSVSAVPFDMLTHINLWFLNPDSLGNFQQDLSALAPFIKAAHDHKVQVLVSIGGGSRQPYYHRLLQPENRSRLIGNLVKVAEQYNLDGVDVDLEGPDIDAHYEAFVTELGSLLHTRQKLMTAAIAVYYKDALTDKALGAFDFVNVMSYDRTGPWRPEKPGPHATYAHAVEDLAYFGGQRAIPKEKLVLGVPFYGYGFGPDTSSPAISMNYGEIVTGFTGAESKDELRMPDGKILYYNGLATIRQKTALARQKASGIMIWQLKGDAPGKLSLLRAINEVAYGKN